MYSYIVLALCERPICHNSITAIGKLFSGAESRTPDPLNKSQIQSRPERNIDKKAQPFSKTACLFLRQWKVYVLLRFRHKQAQPRTQDERSALNLPAALADINIHLAARSRGSFGEA